MTLNSATGTCSYGPMQHCQQSVLLFLLMLFTLKGMQSRSLFLPGAFPGPKKYVALAVW